MENEIRRTLTSDGTATISIHGEVDFSNAEELADCIRDAVTDWSPAVVRVDLTAAVLIDSTGLGALIEGYRAAGEVAARFEVTNPSPKLHRVLTVTGLGEFFGLSAPARSAVETQASGA
jgi:anti-anti-sigma factor